MVKYNENTIRETAYYIWQNAGCPVGQDEMFWSMAVEQLSNNCNNSSSCKSSTSSSLKKSSVSAAKKPAASKSSTASKSKK